MASDTGNRGHLQREKIFYQLHNSGAVQKICQSHGEKQHGKDFRSDVFNTKIMQELFENELTLAEIGEIDAIDFLTAIKTVHFVMQNIIAEKLLNIVEVEQVEKEKSAFDEYDRENGYEDEDEQPEENQWKVCGEIVDRVVKIAIRLLKNSYSQCMKENIVTLLEYLRFELDTINENQ